MFLPRTGLFFYHVVSNDAIRLGIMIYTIGQQRGHFACKFTVIEFGAWEIHAMIHFYMCRTIMATDRHFDIQDTSVRAPQWWGDCVFTWNIWENIYMQKNWDLTCYAMLLLHCLFVICMFLSISMFVVNTFSIITQTDYSVQCIGYS